MDLDMGPLVCYPLSQESGGKNNKVPIRVVVERDTNLYAALWNDEMAPVKHGLTHLLTPYLAGNWKQDYWHWAGVGIRIMEDLQKYRDEDKAEQSYYLES